MHSALSPKLRRKGERPILGQDRHIPVRVPCPARGPGKDRGERSSAVKERVMAARKRQERRLKGRVSPAMPKWERELGTLVSFSASARRLALARSRRWVCRPGLLPRVEGELNNCRPGRFPSDRGRARRRGSVVQTDDSPCVIPALMRDSWVRQWRLPRAVFCRR